MFKFGCMGGATTTGTSLPPPGDLNAASLSQADVQAAVNAATMGQTVVLPAGTAAWATSVTVNKSIKIRGQGGGRIVAYDDGVAAVTVGTGAKTFTIAGTSPGAATITAGMTLRAQRLGDNASWMQGTVTSLVGSTLTLNITSSAGAGSFRRWIFSTQTSTTIIHNSSGSVFELTGQSTFNVELSQLKITVGTGTQVAVDMGGAANSRPVIIRDCWFDVGANAIHVASNRGLIYHCSFENTPFSMAPLAIHIQPFDTQAWQEQSYWGAADTNGDKQLYVEDCDFHAYLNATDNDEGARSVFRYCLFNNAGYGTHGADTGPIGQRKFEFYNNIGNFNGYSDLTTFNTNWWFFIRGGTFVIYNNILPDIVSTDFGDKSDFNMTVMNLRRSDGTFGCWTGGYPAPRQVGLGYTTGLDNNFSDAGFGWGMVYEGDFEPAYVWNNKRTSAGAAVALQAGLDDFSPNQCGAGAPLTSTFIVEGRDYFNSPGTAKPRYTPYTYPHPLRSG